MSKQETMSCDSCDGEHIIGDIESPDYSVGLMGHSVSVDQDDLSHHDEGCEVHTYTDDQWRTVEYNLSIKVAEGYFNEEPDHYREDY